MILPAHNPAPVVPRCLPVRRAELFVPTAEGRPKRIRKVPGDTPRGNGAFPQFRLHQNRLVCVDAQGNPTASLRLRDSDMPGALLGAPGSPRAWFSTNRAVYALDTRTGQMTGQRELTYEWSPKAMHLDGDHVIVANGKKLEWLDVELKTVKTLDVSHDVKTFIPIGHGMLALSHYARPHRITLLDAEGHGHMELPDAAAPVVDARGRLFCIEGEMTRDQPRHVICYDPATDHLSRVPTSSRARSVVPRRDGSFIVMHDEDDRPALLLHREGQEPRRFDFGSRGYVRELLLDENDSVAYVMLDRYRNGNRKGQTVYRIDLDKPKTLAQRLGITRAVETVHELDTRSEAPRLAAMDDGHLLLVDDAGATLVDPQRGESRPLGDKRQAVEQALGDSRLVTRPVQFGYARLERPGLDALLDGAKSTERDGCLDLPVREAPSDAPKPPTSGRLPSAVEFWPHKILVRSGGRTSNVFLPPNGIKFTAAATAHNDERKMLVAAATSNGQVHCYDPLAGIGGRPVARFDVGSPIKRLGTDESGRIVAEGENGSLLLVEP